MDTRFAQRVSEDRVRHDLEVLSDFVEMWCESNHSGRDRRGISTEAALLGAYGRRTPRLCGECEAHLAYAEARRVACPKDPKPFCSHCDVHCYRADEAEWQRTVMRFAGPRSWRRGHALDGLRHMLEGLALGRRKPDETDRRAAQPAPDTKEA